MTTKHRLGALPLRLGAALVLGGGAVAGMGGQADAFPIQATDGQFMAYLSTNSTIINPPELPAAGALDDDISGDGNNEFDKATLQISFLVQPNTIGGPSANDISNNHVRFDMAVLTSEFGALFAEADPFLVELSSPPDPIAPPGNASGGVIVGTQTFGGAIGANNGDLSAFNGPFIDPVILGPEGSLFFDGHTEFFEVAFEIIGTGLYTLTFAVGDEGDSFLDTAILVDNIRTDFGGLITSFEPGEQQDIGPAALPQGPSTGNVSIVQGQQFQQVSIPEPASLSLMSAGLLGLGAAAIKRRRRKVKTA